MSTNWRQADHHFKFQLGDKTLLSVLLPLQVTEVGLGQDSKAVSAHLPPTETLENGCEGFLIRSIPVEAPLPMFSPAGSCLRYVPSQYPRSYIDLNMSFADYGKKFSSKTRSTINRKLNKFAEYCGGTLQWKSYKTPEEIIDFYRLARAVSAKTYQEKLLNSGMPEGDAFIQELQTQAEANAVRGYILFNSAEPVAYIYSPARQGVLLYEHQGYDPAYREWSAGTVLQWLALEDIFGQKKIRIFDFTEGESDHKRLFGTHHIQCANI